MLFASFPLVAHCQATRKTYRTNQSQAKSHRHRTGKKPRQKKQPKAIFT
jgi:hypothetical protein